MGSLNSRVIREPLNPSIRQVEFGAAACGIPRNRGPAPVLSSRDGSLSLSTRRKCYPRGLPRGFPGKEAAYLLELARLLGAQAPAIRVDLVAYALEEPPFFRTRQMGSAHHAQSLKTEGAAVKAMIALEMIGRFSDAPGSQNYPSMLISPLYSRMARVVQGVHAAIMEMTR